MVHSIPVLCSVAQSCLTLCDPMDCSPPCSAVHGILQARILEGVAILHLHTCSQLILITVLQVKYYVPWFLAEEIRFIEVKPLTKNHITSMSISIPLDYDSSSKRTLDFLKTPVHNITWLPLPLFITIQFQNLNSGTGVMHTCLVASDSVTVWTIARQAPLSMGFFEQEYWNWLPFSPPGDRWGYWQSGGFKTIHLVCSERWLWANWGAGVQGGC